MPRAANASHNSKHCGDDDDDDDHPNGASHIQPLSFRVFSGPRLCGGGGQRGGQCGTVGWIGGWVVAMRSVLQISLVARGHLPAHHSGSAFQARTGCDCDGGRLGVVRHRTGRGGNGGGGRRDSRLGVVGWRFPWLLLLLLLGGHVGVPLSKLGQRQGPNGQGQENSPVSLSLSSFMSLSRGVAALAGLGVDDADGVDIWNLLLLLLPNE